MSTNGVLAGSGTISVPVTISTNGAIGGGTSTTLGTLTVNNSLTFNGGGGLFRVSHGASPSSDEVSVSGAIVNNSTVGFIVVTNVGVRLQPGYTFTLFNKGVTGGNNFNVVGAGATWNNNLTATPATISVASTNVPVITPSYNNPSSGALTLSWAGYTGWLLQSNSVGLTVSTNWITVPGSSFGSSIVLTNSLARTNIFYRLTSQ